MPEFLSQNKTIKRKAQTAWMGKTAHFLTSYKNACQSTGFRAKADCFARGGNNFSPSHPLSLKI